MRFLAIALTLSLAACGKDSPADLWQEQVDAQNQILTWFGAYNRTSEEVEWRLAETTHVGDGVTSLAWFGVYCPKFKGIQWRQAAPSGHGRKALLALTYSGVLNEYNGVVEWRVARLIPDKPDPTFVMEYAGVYDPQIGKVRWYEGERFTRSDGNSVSRVPRPIRNEATGEIELGIDHSLENEAYTVPLPLTGVYNPETGQVEWSRAIVRRLRDQVVVTLPMAGVFNPLEKKVEWRVADHRVLNWKTGKWIALPWHGVFNPKAGFVEWRIAELP